MERVAIVGAGAVGCYFGGMLARAGVPVTLIGRARHVDVIKKDGLLLERAGSKEYVKLNADTQVEAVRDATIVLMSAKTVDTETAAISVAPYLRKDALFVCFQNGVDNAVRAKAAAGIDAIPCVVYVACAMTGPGHVTHHGRGDIVIGNVPRIAALFESAKIPCRISDNVMGELWTKLVMNCVYNALSAVTHARYRPLRDHPLVNDLMKRLVEEVAAVGRAAKVVMPSVEDLTNAALKLGDSMPNATSSTEQDLSLGRPTEIDSLNGYVVRRGSELGVPTPVNTTLYALVKFLERPS